MPCIKFLVVEFLLLFLTSVSKALILKDEIIFENGRNNCWLLDYNVKNCLHLII